MARRVFTFASAFSLLLAMAVACNLLIQPARNVVGIDYSGSTELVFRAGGFTVVHYNIPHGPYSLGWVILLLVALPLAWVVVTWRSKKLRDAQAAGCCAACGYDLRASKERCPECGTAIPAKVETA
jgi:hypothetical protein